MRLIFLGTGGSVSTSRRNTTGVYLPDYNLLLDAGSNVFLLRDLHGSEPLTVLMSHFHVDHSVGLFYLAAGIFHPQPQPEITVYGPEGLDRFRAMAGGGSPLFPIELPFRFERAPERFQVGSVEVETHSVPHTAPVLAYRLHLPTGESLAFVTDTTAPGEYADFVRGVDVLLHECTFRREDAELAAKLRHSDTEGVARLAAEAGVGQLYLLHVGPAEDGLALLDEVREGFPNAELAVEGEEYPRPTSVDPRRAIFPGTFDPITVGHLDIIHTCAEMFTSLDVVVARNPEKDARALFSPSERAEMIRRCVPAGVGVEVWDGLTVGYARRRQAARIVRGLGRAEDYTLEVRLWKTNALLAPEIQTVWVPPRAEHLDVSSSLIKEASLFGGWDGVRHLVPEPIRDEVGERVARRRSEIWR